MHKLHIFLRRLHVSPKMEGVLHHGLMYETTTRKGGEDIAGTRTNFNGPYSAVNNFLETVLVIAGVS